MKLSIILSCLLKKFMWIISVLYLKLKQKHKERMGSLMPIYISSYILIKTSNNKLYYCFLFAKLIDMLRTGGENNNS